MPICSSCKSIVDDNIAQCPLCGNLIKEENINYDKIVNEQLNVSNVINENLIRKKQELLLEDSEQLILHSPDTEEIELQEYEKHSMPLALEVLPRRNYILWFLIGIASFGFGFFGYLYLNLEDLEKHSYYPNEFKAEPIQIRATSLLVLFLISICFLFIPILWYIYYLKYATLYHHLKNQKHLTAPRKLPHPAFYMTPLILSHLSALVHPIIYSFTNIDIKTSIPWLFWLIVAFVIIFTIPICIFDFLWQSAYNEHVFIAMKQLGVLKEEHK